MAGFDTSNVAATVGQGVQPMNPFGVLSSIAGIQNERNQNLMFQAQARGNQYLEQSLGPDGRPDPAKLNAYLMSDPVTAPAAGEIMSRALAQQGAGIANAQASQQLASSYAGPAQKAMAAIPPSTNPDPVAAAQENKVNAITAMAPLVQAGVIDQPTFTAFASMSPTDFETARLTAVNSGAGGAYAQTANYGNTALTNLGGVLQGVNINPVKGTVSTVGSPIDETLTPAEKASGVATVGSDNLTHREPLANFVTDTGQAKPGVAPPQIALPPGVEATAGAAGTGSAQQLNAQRVDAASAQTRILSLKKALQGVQGAQTGPGSDALNNAKSVIQTFSPTVAQTLGIDPQKIANYDEANKYLTQYAAGTAGAFGPSTDMKLATAASGNASTHISNLAAQDVIRVNIGLERMKQAQVAAFDAAGQPGGAGNFSTWSSQWSRSVDPRAFMLDVLPKADRVKMLSTVKTPSDVRQFLAGKHAAEAAGQFGEGDIPQ